MNPGFLPALANNVTRGKYFMKFNLSKITTDSKVVCAAEFLHVRSQIKTKHQIFTVPVCKNALGVERQKQCI